MTENHDTLQWMRSNPVHGPGISTVGGGVYRIQKHYTGRWALWISGKLSEPTYRTQREAKAAAEAYEAAHPWDRTGHR